MDSYVYSSVSRRASTAVGAGTLRVPAPPGHVHRMEASRSTDADGPSARIAVGGHGQRVDAVGGDGEGCAPAAVAIDDIVVAGAVRRDGVAREVEQPDLEGLVGRRTGYHGADSVLP